MISGLEAREKFRHSIKEAFAEVVGKRKGHLEVAAAAIGSSRQSLEQYAAGTVPRADVLLAAFIIWEMVIRIEDPSRNSCHSFGQSTT